MYKPKILLIVLVTVILIGTVSATVYSAVKKDVSYSTFGVQPGKIEFNGSIIKKQEAKILVINFSNHPIEVNVKFSDFIFTNNPKRLYIFAESNDLPVSAIPYIKVSPRRLIIPAKSRKEVKVTYYAGKKIISGKYSSILFQVEGKIKTGKSSLSITGRISSNVFITPGKGFINRKGQINFFKAKSSFGLPGGLFNLSKSPGFTLSFKDSGNTHLNLRGKIFVKNIFGRKVQTINLPDYEVYPNTTRNIQIPWTAPIIGFYKAKIQTNSYLYEYKRLEMSKESSFFYIPYQIIIGAFILLVSALIYLFVRYRKQKKIVDIKTSSGV